MPLLLVASNRSGIVDSMTPEYFCMKPSVVYLHLLQHTPPFARLATDQPGWTIRHSHKGEATLGGVGARCETDSANRNDDNWILLDGL